MNITTPTEVEAPVLVSSKKQRSARSSGKKGWTAPVPEIRRSVGCSYSANDGFSPHTLVWAKLDGGPWWPARVVGVDEIPEDLKKQEEGWTCVKYYALNSTKSFAWVKAEDLSTFEKNVKEFSLQSIPQDFNGGSFKEALNEIHETAELRKIQENAHLRNANATPKASSGTAKHEDSKVLQASPSQNEEDVKDGANAGDVTEQPLKRRKLKFKAVERVPMTDDYSDAHSKGKEYPKELKGQDKTIEIKNKRKRMAKQQTESDGEAAATGESVELLSKKSGSTTPNASSLSSREVVKKARGKKTGADGYYFECMVCDIGGNLLCCDLCPRVYHLGCLDPPLKRTPPGKWICPVCSSSKVVGTQTSDSKPKVKTTNETEETATVAAPKMRPGPKKGWKMLHRGKQLTPDLDLRKLRKRKREEDMERPRKKLNLKLNRSLSSQAQPKCRQCGSGLHSSGESSSSVFCSDCVELVRNRNLQTTGRTVHPRKDMIPTRHSKLKPGKCDVCSKPGLVIFCDLCPRGFHKDCLDPPRKRAPKGAWCCPKCVPVKELKEGKDVKVLREGRVAANEIKEGKTMKAAKVVRDIEKREDGKDEQTSAIPASLEVDRILGCRSLLGSPSTSDLVESVGGDKPSACKPLGSLEDGLKSEPGHSTLGPRSEEGKVIEIRLSICEGEQIEKDISVGPTEPSSAPEISAVIGAVPESIDNVGCKSTSPLMVARDGTIVDLSSTTKSEDLESGGANDVPSKFKKLAGKSETLLETRAVEEFTTDGEDKESRKGRRQTTIPDAAGSGDMPRVNIRACKPQELVSSLTEGGDFENRSSLELTSSSKVATISDEVLPPVNDDGKMIKDSPLVSKDVAVISDKDVSHKSSGLAVPHAELQYLVKWAGKAHIHNEWVSEDFLRSIAKRKLENFKLKHGNAPKMLVEDNWVKPQRIVAKRTVQGNGDEVLVKWSGLSYEECTWEPVDHQVIVGHVELIGLFERFEQEARSDAELVGKDADILDPLFVRGQRPPEIETIKEQPEYLKGGSLFPHQMEALNWLRNCWHRQRSVILADEMGLGKTISACSFIASLRHEFKVRAPCLVLVPLSTMPNWLAEFALWAPFLNVIEYHGSSKARSLIREYEWHSDVLDGASKNLKHTFKFNVMLTTYEMVIQDASQLRAVPWEVLVVDEGHRLKNSSSKLFTLLNTFSFSHRVLLTGTPLQNNFGEMFNLLNFLQPDVFPSLAAFQDKFSSLSTAEQVEELKKLVAPNMLRRLKKDAMQKIPPKTELVVPVDMNSVQVEYYKALLTRNYQVLRNGGKHQSMLNIVMQLRKVCNHPYLIAGTEPDTGTPEFLQEMRINASAKLMLLHSMLGKLKADGHRVLIFSQMTKLLDILEDYLSFEFGNDAFERVDGSVSVAERQTAIARFNQDTSRFVFLLSTRACGLGINLATADTVIIYDSDFNPQADIQAMNRAHRIGQSKTLLVYRLVVRASVEERILQLAKKKLMLDHLFANKSGSQKEVDDILKWGTEELFQETCVMPDEPSSGSGISVAGDDGEAKQRKKGGELGDMYGGYYLQSGRSKVVWDDAAVGRLLDRSDLTTSHPEDGQGEQESDILGSVKAWDWNEQDPVPEEQDGEATLDKESAVQNVQKNPTADEDNQWDKLLRSRWETLQTDEEAALGRGKRNRKTVFYMESNGQKSKELLSESSDMEKEDDPEPDYTPAGRALKQKLVKLRARQKDRIMQRYSNEAIRSVDGDKLMVLATGTGILRNFESTRDGHRAPRLISTHLPSFEDFGDAYSPADAKINVPSPTLSQGLLNVSVGVEEQATGTGILRNFESTRDGHRAPRLISTHLPSFEDFGDAYSLADSKINAPSPTLSQGLLNVSVGVEEQALHKSSLSPSVPITNLEWHRNISSPRITQFPISTGLSKPTDEVGDNSKGSRNNHGPAAWHGSATPAVDKPVTMSLTKVLFGKPVSRADDNMFAPGRPLSKVSLSKVSQGLESGRSLSQLLPALRNSLHGAQYGDALQSSAPVQLDLRDPTAAAIEGASNNNSSQEDSGFNIFSRSASGAKSLLDKSQPPDVALKFSQRIFGWEKNLNMGDPLSAGEDSSGQQSKQGKMLPTNPSSIFPQDDNFRPKLQRSDNASGTDVSLQSSKQGAKAPNLSIALGLQLMEASPPADGREARTSTPAALSKSISTGVSIKTADIQGVGSISHPNNLFHKLGTKDMMPIELDDDEPESIVSTRRFLSPGIGEGARGRAWHIEDQRKRKEEGSPAWSEDELDALWTGVRRHGVGNWAAMLLDVRLCFLKSRSVGELADRWKAEQMKMFGNPELSSEAGNKAPNQWTGTTAMSGMESDLGRGLSHTIGRERGLARLSGTEKGPTHTSGADRGRPSHTRVLLTSTTNSESAVVQTDDKLFSRNQEKKESLPSVPDFEKNPPKERHPYQSTSKPGAPSTLSGLQFVNKTGDFGRLEISKQGLNYHNILDLQSGRSSPSIPISIPGRSTASPGAAQGVNVGSFALSSEGIGRLNDSLFRTTGTAHDQIGAEGGPSLSPGLGLGSDWRKQEAREKAILHQQRPAFPVTDGGKYQSSLADRSGVLRSQDPNLNVQTPPAPGGRLGSPPGHSLGNKAIVSLPHNGGPISTAEHRRRARGGSSAKAMSSVHADDSAPSNLPHWLREAVKAKALPPPPPLPPAIAALVQATNICYNSKPLLPPLTHPGYPLVPPREFPKKVKKKQRRKISHQQRSIRTESLAIGNASETGDLSRPIKVEGLNQSLVPPPNFDNGGALNRLAAPGQVSSSLLWSKGFPDLPLLSGLDHPKQQQTSHIPADSLSELMATRRSIIELGLMAGLHPSIVSALNLDEFNTQSSLVGKGRRPWQDLGSDSGRVWTASQSLPGSALAPSSSLAPTIPLSSERHLSRNSQGAMLSQGLPVGRMGEGSFSELEKKSQLPQWLTSIDTTKLGSSGGQERQPEVDVGNDDDNESTSSKTVSDPGVRSKCGKDNGDSDDASSEETISDDGTQ